MPDTYPWAETIEGRLAARAEMVTRVDRMMISEDWVQLDRRIHTETPQRSGTKEWKSDQRILVNE